MRLVSIGGCLTVTIPRDLMRELGLVARESVMVQRGVGRRLEVIPLDEWTRDRERIQGHPRRAN